MKKILFVVLFFILMLGATVAQEQVYYRVVAGLEWNPVTEIDGHPLLPEDTMEYEVYAWDRAGGNVLTQPVENLIYITTVSKPTALVVFPYYAEWILGFRAKHTNGNNEITYSGISYTIEEVPVTQDGPFYYGLASGAIQLEKPTGLRDSEM